MNWQAPAVSRRKLLAGSGALIVSFCLSRSGLAQQAQGPRLPGSLRTTPMLDSWIRIDADGVTVFTGKAELGQGIKTALLQIAAEELSLSPEDIALVTADTARTADEGYTAGSLSMQDSGTAIRHAAAQVRELLLQEAAKRLRLPADQLTVSNGAATAPDGRKLPYGELVSDSLLHVTAQPQSRLKDAGSYAVIGKPVPRVDIPAKVTGGLAYVHDLRLPGMVHARIVRPPGYAARLRALDTAAVEHMPGVLKLVRDGSFLAVITEREYQAIRAADALALAAQWDETSSRPDQANIHDWLRAARSDDSTIHESHAAAGTPARTLEATYQRPYHMHASIGPSCAVGLLEGEMLTVWTHSQGVYPLRDALAEMLRMPEERIRCIHMEGSGCYGHNGADDVAADAALTAIALPGRPVRVQWMRDQEHTWEPLGAAMLSHARASLDANGEIVDWSYEVWSNSHLTRPPRAGNLAPAWHLSTPFSQPVPEPIPQPAGGGDRNAIPLYRLPNSRVVHHFIPEMPLRVSALRALGGYMNVFAIESFIDELALAANADPVEFRLRHLDDSRAQDVLRAAAEKFGWRAGEKSANGRGRGVGFARYKNLAAYTAVVAEVEVDRETGRVRPVRFVCGNDSGEIVNPDGVRNQIEGGIIQSTSWTLLEAVNFDQSRITSRDWSTYPILRFPDLPDKVDVHLIDRPGQAFLGTGEAAQGPTAAAIANAIADATGTRVRELPFTRKRIKAAIGV